MPRQQPDLVAAGLAGVPFARSRHFRRGSFLVEAGCPAEVVYLVRSGLVREFLLDEDGRETTTAILGPGQLVGLAPLLGHAVHHEFAQALTAIDAWALPVPPLREQLASDPALLGLVVGSVAQRVGVALGLLRDVALWPVAERARDIEARLAACLGGNPPALNRTTLAGLIQARPETLARLPTWEHRPAQASHPPAEGTALEQPVIESAAWGFRSGASILHGELPTGRVGQVLSGQVQLALDGAGRRALVIDTLLPGDLFGIAALLGLPPVRLQLVALSDGAVEVLRTGELLRRVADQPDALMRLLHRLGARLERLERRLARAAAANTRQALLDLLRELAAQDGQGQPAGARALPGGWSHTALAQQMGVCRETVTRALAALASAGAIRREGRQIVLLAGDGHALSADADPIDARPRQPPRRAGGASPKRMRPRRRTVGTARPAATRHANREIRRRTACTPTEDTHRLRDALRCLRAVRRAGKPDLIDAIREEVERLARPSA